jgi:hypothetical protein
VDLVSKAVGILGVAIASVPAAALLATVTPAVQSSQLLVASAPGAVEVERRTHSGATGGCYVNGKWYPEGALVAITDSSPHWNDENISGICENGRICQGQFCRQNH